MRTRLTTVTELKQIFIENVLNNTSKISKVSEDSVVNGIAFANAKIAQKAIKDIAIVEAHTMVDSAYGVQLDDIADAKGIAERFGTSDSSTFVRVVGDVGTLYESGTHTITGSHGIVFNIEEDVTIGDHGYAYVKVRSQTVGEKTNIDGNTLVTIAPVPVGHEFATNEYGAFGGRDAEDDAVFKKRIKEGANLAATSTISKLTQICNKINPAVIRVFYHGTNSQSQVILALSTHNGIDLTGPELSDIENKLEEFLAISDLKPINATSSKIELKNIDYQLIDVVFRVDIQASVNPDLIRKDIQVQFSKYLDYRFWKPNRKVEWDELLSIVRHTRGVRSVPDTKFNPNVDVVIDNNKLPRFRGFQMLDLAGNIISNVSGTLNPIYYPTNPDSSYQRTILASI